MKKEIPALFSTIMVQSIMKGIKTKTSRTKGLDKINEAPAAWDLINDFRSDFGKTLTFQFSSLERVQLIKCPYGKPGDVLWVRETFIEDTTNGEDWFFVYKADCENYPTGSSKWRPSLFMPKTACRIWLEVEDITCQRLHQISESDAIAEGVERESLEGPVYYKNYNDLTRLHEYEFSTPKDAFETLWIKINGVESWNLNPWVWVVSFKVLSTTGRPANLPLPTSK